MLVSVSCLWLPSLLSWCELASRRRRLHGWLVEEHLWDFDSGVDRGEVCGTASHIGLTWPSMYSQTCCHQVSWPRLVSWFGSCNCPGKVKCILKYVTTWVHLIGEGDLINLHTLHHLLLRFINVVYKLLASAVYQNQIYLWFRSTDPMKSDPQTISC